MIQLIHEFVWERQTANDCNIIIVRYSTERLLPIEIR